MTYGILAGGSRLLTNIVDQLHEKAKKVNVVERFTKHLANGIPEVTVNSYLSLVRTMAPSDPVIFIDDSDVVKPDERHFECLGLVRDGAKSSDPKNVYEKGYYITEACILTTSGQPVSIFSRIHSSKEKDFTSINDITFSAMERGTALFEKVTVIMGRGYDDNKMFLKLDDLKQDYVIRLTAKRKLYFHGKWVPATQLRDQRKGKIKTLLVYKGKSHDAYLSHVKVQITASRKDIYLVLVYGITEHPMILATNKEIRSRENVKKLQRPISPIGALRNISVVKNRCSGLKISARGNLLLLML